MKITQKTRKSIAQLFLVFCLSVGGLMPLAVLANDDNGPQEGGRGRRAPAVTCSSTSYNIIIATVTVTSCSDGSWSMSVS